MVSGTVRPIQPNSLSDLRLHAYSIIGVAYGVTLGALPDLKCLPHHRADL